MEGCSFMHSKDSQKHRPLTPWRILRGTLCLIVLVLTAFMLLIYGGFWAAVGLRFFSIHHSRTVTSFFFGSWIALWPFFFEKVNQTKVVFSGDSVPERERVLLIANHRTEVDWMYLWNLALRKSCVSYIKYVLKSSLMKMPVFGWVFHIVEFIPVERKWETDESTMHQMLSTFKDPRDPLWLAVFPEGTDFTEQKCLRSQKLAAEKGLPVMINVLLPKSKGFYACIKYLRGSLDAVYDITIAYKHRCPSFMDNAFGVDPAEVHINIRRVDLSEIPSSEDEATSWLMEAFRLKDQLLSDFQKTGHFPGEGIEAQLSTTKCLLNFAFVTIWTGLCTYLTLFSSVWFKVYVTSACVYLASATHFNVRPKPILSL